MYHFSVHQIVEFMLQEWMSPTSVSNTWTQFILWLWWQTTAAVENDKNNIIQITDRCLFVSKHETLYIIWSWRKQLNILSHQYNKQSCTILDNRWDYQWHTHCARHLWHAPTGPCHHGQMMAAEKQTGHQLISNNHTESAVTTMSHGPYYAIHIYIAWQPLNKLCWERIRGSTPIGFCVIAEPFSLSDTAL